MIATKHIEKGSNVKIIGVPDKEIKTNRTKSIHNNIEKETFLR